MSYLHGDCEPFFLELRFSDKRWYLPRLLVLRLNQQ